MVTASAPAVPDPHAITTAALTPPNSTATPISFQSVYQSLPFLPGEPGDLASPQLLNAKTAGSKQSQAKGSNDKLAATAALALTADLPPARPWVPAPPSLSMTAQAPAAEAQSTGVELASQSYAHVDAALELAGSGIAQRGVNAAKSLQATLDQAIVPGKVISKTIPVAPPDGQPAPVPAASVNPVQIVAAALPVQVPQRASSRDRASNLSQPRGDRSLSLAPQSLPLKLQASTASVQPESQQSAPDPSKGSSDASARQPSVAPVAISKELANSLAPRIDNQAFALRMQETGSAAHRAPGTSPVTPARNQPGSETKIEARPSASSSAAPTTHVPPAANTPDGFSSASANLLWTDASAMPHSDIPPGVQLSAAQEPTHSSVLAALHDIQPMLPEAPRPNTTGEILLQLGSKDQSAAIRVTDRAGAINVSVHANDPDLRSSLRSNLGELASQLTNQGWKTDVVKPGTVLPRAETPHDSQPDGQRSSSQQQSYSGGERQPQRDRRANGEQWLTELEEIESGNSGNQGGRN